MSRRRSAAGSGAPVPAKLSRPRLYEQIVAQLEQHILDHGLTVGDRLPPERELAEALGVSRASLAQALVALEVVGVVQVRHGDGAVVAARPGGSEGLVKAVRAHHDALPDIIDARSALEAKLAALAAQRRTDEDMAAIDEAIAQMEAEARAGERGLEGDRAFHAAVTRAGHSPVLARLMGEIGELIIETRIESLSQPGRPLKSVAMHRDIAEAIRRGDAAAAASAMSHHISVVSDVPSLHIDSEE